MSAFFLVTITLAWQSTRLRQRPTHHLAISINDDTIYFRGKVVCGGEVGDAMAQRLKRSDGFAELLALFDVCDGVVQRALADAQADCSAKQPLAVETGHDLREPSPDLGNDVLGGNEAVGEEDVVDLATAQRRDAACFNAFGIAGYFEDGQTRMRFFVAAGSRDQYDSPRPVCIRAPRLLAVEHVAIGNRLGPRKPASTRIEPSPVVNPQRLGRLRLAQLQGARP